MNIKKFLRRLHGVPQTADKTVPSSISYFSVQLAGTFWYELGNMGCKINISKSGTKLS